LQNIKLYIYKGPLPIGFENPRSNTLREYGYHGNSLEMAGTPPVLQKLLCGIRNQFAVSLWFYFTKSSSTSAKHSGSF